MNILGYENENAELPKKNVLSKIITKKSNGAQQTNSDTKI